MPSRPTVAMRSRRHGSDAARNEMSRDFIQLDLVPEGVEHVNATPPRNRFGLLETRAARAQGLHRRVQIVHAQREVAARMKAELAVGREMDVTGRRRIPDARTIA